MHGALSRWADDQDPCAGRCARPADRAQADARPGFSPRDRSLITVASLVTAYRQNELPFHRKKALENGVTRDELVEAVTHLAFYAGWPTASTAIGTMRDVFADTDSSNQ